MSETETDPETDLDPDEDFPELAADPAKAPPFWIAVDWGTSALRAWAMRGEEKLAEARSADGMGGLSPEEFEPALLGLIAPWLSPGAPVPVLACGMVGARQGWSEAPYRAVPCAPVAGRGALHPVPTRDLRIAVRIVPGLSQAAPADVMRGEEVQIAGLLAQEGLSDAVICLPGSHSKWAKIAGGEVESFSTAMTGEAFAALSGHSVLRHAMPPPAEGAKPTALDRPAFLRAVQEMLRAPETLAAALFSVRAETLLAEPAPTPDQSRARLSGLLIGAEIAAMRGMWEGREVHLIGAPELAAAYAEALSAAGVTAHVHDSAPLTRAGLAAAMKD